MCFLFDILCKWLISLTPKHYRGDLNNTLPFTCVLFKVVIPTPPPPIIIRLMQNFLSPRDHSTRKWLGRSLSLVGQFHLEINVGEVNFVAPHQGIVFWFCISTVTIQIPTALLYFRSYWCLLQSTSNCFKIISTGKLLLSKFLEGFIPSLLT